MNPNLKLFLDFIGNHPILTVIILLIFANLVVNIINAIRGNSSSTESDDENEDEEPDHVERNKNFFIKVGKTQKNSTKGKWNWLKKIIK